MQPHHLKTWPGPFQAIVNGKKAFEYRKDDRGFEVGDKLILEEWDPLTREYTFRTMSVHVTYIAHGGEWGIPLGFCVMSLGERPTDDACAGSQKGSE